MMPAVSPVSDPGGSRRVTSKDGKSKRAPTISPVSDPGGEACGHCRNKNTPYRAPGFNSGGSHGADPKECIIKKKIKEAPTSDHRVSSKDGRTKRAFIKAPVSNSGGSCNEVIQDCTKKTPTGVLGSEPDGTRGVISSDGMTKKAPAESLHVADSGGVTKKMRTRAPMANSDSSHGRLGGYADNKKTSAGPQSLKESTETSGSMRKNTPAKMPPRSANSSTCFSSKYMNRDGSSKPKKLMNSSALSSINREEKSSSTGNISSRAKPLVSGMKKIASFKRNGEVVLGWKAGTPKVTLKKVLTPSKTSVPLIRKDQTSNYANVLPPKSFSGSSNPCRVALKSASSSKEENKIKNQNKRKPINGDLKEKRGTENDSSSKSSSSVSDSFSSTKNKIGVERGSKNENTPLVSSNKPARVQKGRTKNGAIPCCESSGQAVKIRFRRGKMIDAQPENSSGPRKLKFRQVRTVGEFSKIRSFARVSFRKRCDNSKNEDRGVKERVTLRHHSMKGKKDAQGLLNMVIEETASKLVETRKSKVKALVGAFETVISLQDPKSGPGPEAHEHCNKIED